MTTSVKPLPIDNRNRDHVREQWRLASLEWSAAEDRASRLESGKKLFLGDAVSRLKAGNEQMSEAKAERIAVTSPQYRDYLRKMHDARREANDLKIMAEDANRLYWELVNSEANERVERRMSR